MSRTAKTPQDWWSTAIVEMRPGMLRFRGYAVEDLIGRVGFADMVWLLTRGELPGCAHAALLEAALVSAVDHGPQAPSIATARMAMTCGVGINNAMASAINMLGDVHGGAGEQCVAFLLAIARRIDASGAAPADAAAFSAAVAAEMTALADAGVRHVPGFGHRFHPVDPRAPRLLELVDRAAAGGAVSGRFAAIARAVEDELARRKRRRIPMNVDGATGVIFAELGFAPALCRGLFVLARSVGALAHAWEESQSDYRNKGPIPRDLTWTYTGPPRRALPRRSDGE